MKYFYDYLFIKFQIMHCSSLPDLTAQITVNEYFKGLPLLYREVLQHLLFVSFLEEIHHNLENDMTALIHQTSVFLGDHSHKIYPQPETTIHLIHKIV